MRYERAIYYPSEPSDLLRLIRECLGQPHTVLGLRKWQRGQAGTPVDEQPISLFLDPRILAQETAAERDGLRELVDLVCRSFNNVALWYFSTAGIPRSRWPNQTTADVGRALTSAKEIREEGTTPDQKLPDIVNAETLLTYWRKQIGHRSRLVVVLQFSTDQPLARSVVEELLPETGGRTLGTILSVGVRPETVNASSVDEIVRHWRTDGYSSSLPEWKPYDHIGHFMEWVYPGYKGDQTRAAEHIVKLLEDYFVAGDVTEVVDLGCGSGELVADLLSELQRVFPKHYGSLDGVRLAAVDPSPFQCQRAQKSVDGLEADGLETVFAEGNVSEVTVQRPGEALVLILGNTLAHIGARKFRYWLVEGEKQGRLPRLIVLDFALQWKELLRQATPEIVCGRIRRPSTAWGERLYVHVSTAGGPGWVKRGIILQYGGNGGRPAGNTLDSDEHRLFTQQSADPPETYFNILRARGYRRMAALERFRSGWGDHELYIWQLEDEEPGTELGAPSVIRSFSWPTPHDRDEVWANEVWYNVLCQAWQDIEGERAFRCRDYDLFPIAILPFSQRVYGRYVPRSEGEEGIIRKLAAAWLDIIVPETAEGAAQGAAKDEGELPYAPSIGAAIRGYDPAPTLEHFDVTHRKYRLDVNAADLELADLERKYFGTEVEAKDRQIYYAVPLYSSGVPLFVVVARTGVSTALSRNLEATGAVIREIRMALVASGVTAVTTYDRWAQLVRQWTEVPKYGNDQSRVRALLNHIHSEKKETNRVWTSWLDCAPGFSMFDRADVRSEFEELKRNHERIVRQLMDKEREERDAARDGEARNVVNIRTEGAGTQVTIAGGDVYIARQGHGEQKIDGKVLLRDIQVVRNDGQLQGGEYDEALRKAEAALQEGDERGFVDALSGVGKGVMRVAERVGARVLASWIEAQYGIPRLGS